MKVKSIFTERLKLDILFPEVYKEAFETLSDEALKGFMGYPDDETLQAEKENYAKGITTAKTSFTNFIVRTKNDDKVVGWCGFHTWYPKHRRAEIGYSISDEQHKRKGYMGEALQAILSYGFNEMGLYRAEALVADYNTASVKLLQKFGFTFEGCLRQHYNVDGVNEDSQMYSLLKDEFII